jgi:hypothetical protein
VHKGWRRNLLPVARDHGLITLNRDLPAELTPQVVVRVSTCTNLTETIKQTQNC